MEPTGVWRGHTIKQEAKLQPMITWLPPASWHRCLAWHQYIFRRPVFTVGKPTFRQRQSAVGPTQLPLTLTQINPSPLKRQEQAGVAEVPEIPRPITPGPQDSSKAFGPLGPQISLNTRTQQRGRMGSKENESCLLLGTESSRCVSCSQRCF